jgi:RNA polymerase sigma-70 factor (ECF subfamily)
MDDDLLLRRIGEGDRTAMKALYERHSRPLYHFIRTRVGDAFEASDVMQETFLELWRSAGRFDGRSSARTWIYAIARNKTVDRIRKSARVTLRDQPDETVPDDSPSAQDLLEAASDVSRVRACLEKLGEVQRSAIRLAFFEDLSYPEVAEVEGVPVGTIKTRIHHAKKLLLHCLSRTERGTA